MDLDKLIDELIAARDNGAIEFGLYDEAGQAYEVAQVDDQDGGGAPVSIRIKKANW